MVSSEVIKSVVNFRSEYDCRDDTVEHVIGNLPVLTERRPCKIRRSRLSSSRSMSTAYSSKRAARRARATFWEIKVESSEKVRIEERGARTKSIVTYQPVPSVSVVGGRELILLSGEPQQ